MGTCPSDERLKTDITPITGSLDTLRQFNYYNYKYKEDAPEDIAGKWSAGVMAQDMVTQYNKAIIYNYNKVIGASEDPDATRYMGIDYVKFIPLTINAIKELSTKLSQLSANLSP